MSDGTGEAPKKETVYGGSAPAMDNQAFANPPSGTTGTVYGGPTPTQGTVYSGPTPGQGTVYGSSSTRAAAPVRAGMDPVAIKGANWFFWIAGLSAFYSILALSGFNKYPIFGMGVTMLAGPTAGFIAAGVVGLLGYFARQGQKWAFLIGMALYAMDGIALATNGIYLGLAFHAYALFCIFRGFQAL
jgi:hypothetical protein